MNRLACLLGLLLLAACGQAPPAGSPPQPLARSLAPGVGDADFDQVAPRALTFPGDHGAHPGHRIEWWYLTARLRDAAGRPFGVQFALFRYALRPEEQAAREDWQGAQVYMLHAALSDLQGGGFHHVERFARGAGGMAGVALPPYRAWLGDCRAESAQPGTLFPLRLDCGGEDFRYRLDLLDGGPRVLHGEAGYSAKTAEPGAASFYYAYPFIEARGEIELAGSTHQVGGQAWYDHEWTSRLLAPGQAGWDWFSLRLSDGSALMLFHIRDRQGAAISSRGSLVAADGSVQAFVEGTVEATPTRWWRSPKSGVRYPLGWRLRSQRFDFDLEIDTSLPAQELSTTVRYWEGAVDARGRRGASVVTGEGYLELTGYGE